MVVILIIQVAENLIMEEEVLVESRVKVEVKEVEMEVMVVVVAQVVEVVEVLVVVVVAAGAFARPVSSQTSWGRTCRVLLAAEDR